MVLVKVYSKLQAHYTSYMDMDKFFLVWGYNFHYTACLASCVLQHPQAPTCLPIALYYNMVITIFHNNNYDKNGFIDP